MQNQRLLWIGLVVIVIVGVIYYQQHTHTASLDLPGNHSVSVTTHD